MAEDVVEYIVDICLSLLSCTRVSTTPGNPENLLEFTGPPGNFCVR